MTSQKWLSSAVRDGLRRQQVCAPQVRVLAHLLQLVQPRVLDQLDHVARRHHAVAALAPAVDPVERRGLPLPGPHRRREDPREGLVLVVVVLGQLLPVV
jgi:hypothetical protein